MPAFVGQVQGLGHRGADVYRGERCAEGHADALCRAGKEGKPPVKGHQAVIGNDIPTQDSVIEFRFRLGGAQSVTAEFDDRKFNGSHYGHLCMARIAADKITLDPETGSLAAACRRILSSM